MVKNYTSPEIVEYICDKCTLTATLARLTETLGRMKGKENIPGSQESSASPGARQRGARSGYGNVGNGGLSSKKAQKKSMNKKVFEISELESKINFIKTSLKEGKFDISLPQDIPRLKFYSNTTKQMTLGYAPPCICFHMQRSIFLPSGHTVKNNSPVIFGDSLDLNDLVLGPGYRTNVLEKLTTLIQDQNITRQDSLDSSIPINPVTTSLLQTHEYFKAANATIAEPRPAEASTWSKSLASGPFVYRLMAVILHYGHHESGHFVTLRRVVHSVAGIEKDVWFRVSDTHVDQIEDVEHEVFSHGSRYAFMLFYERT
ncbi:hypothetical protein HDU91_006281 [Kappamyces sp. JEL0680]|nr:hypothetical protein HDU91_006281 [Kappamyces sp. JEL0680]